MSFSTETKSELAHYQPPKECCRLAEIAGFIRLCGTVSLIGFGKFKIDMPTDSPAIARHYKTLIKEYFDVDAPISIGEGNRFRKGNEYILSLGPEENSEAILREIGFLMVKGGMNYFTDGIYTGIIRTKCCRKAFLRGAFMAAGTVSDPVKEYHLEIRCSSHDIAMDTRKLVKTFSDLNPKVVKRKSGESVYLKSGNEIADVLAIMNANDQNLKFNEAMINKEIRNQTVRLMNCDNANADKIAKASNDQIDAIHKIQRIKGLESLPAKLREVAELRLENPGISFTELGEMMDPPVGRSGLSKRFKKIEEIAEGLVE